MFKFTLALIATSALADQDFTYRFKGQNYQSWLASEKHGRIMRELLEDTNTAEYNYNIDVLFEELDMNSTTCNENDEIPNRPKTLHQKGAVASVSYEDLGGHDYTGLFTGAQYGIIRMSDSGFLVDGVDQSNPSVALKFFTDEEEAQNLLFMIDFNNQQGQNFFPVGKPFTTHPEPFKEEDTCNRKTIVKKMKEGSFMPFANGTGDFAAVNEDGTEVETEVFPYELQLRVNYNAVPAWTEGTDQMDYLKSITMTTDDAPLFSVWARADPPAEDEDTTLEHFQEIGLINLKSDVTGSLFGDQRLFFRHEPFNRDCDRLRKQGDRARSKLWRMAERSRMPYELGNEWGETEVNDMGADAMQTVEDGIRNQGCPFAWLLA